MGHSNDLILKVENLQTQFDIGSRQIKSVKGVSFNVKKGRTMGIVGESGCGKSVTALSILQLLPKAGTIHSGTITYYSDAEEIVLSRLKKNENKMRSVRGKEISMIFQDPMASLNPLYTIGNQICENLLQHERINKREATERAITLLTQLGIPKAASRLKDYPHQFSGGMKQRTMIAMAMINNPKLLIADEPTTALDVTIQAQILELMKDIQQKLGTSIILITHNMGIISDMADDVAVMYMGRIIEYGTVQQILDNPRHPYTKALLKSVPVLGAGKTGRLQTIRGNTPSPSDVLKGCAFMPRCDFATAVCASEPPEIDLGEGHNARCWNCREGVKA